MNRQGGEAITIYRGTKWMSPGILSAIRNKKRTWKKVRNGLITKEYRKCGERSEKYDKEGQKKILEEACSRRRLQLSALFCLC
jgi:hypothetical protein